MVKPKMLVAGCALLAATAVAEDQARMLIDEGLVTKRPAGQAGARSKPVTYKPIGASVRTPKSADSTDVGVTFWRLRLARPDDDPETRILLLDEETGQSVEQVPERIEAGTPLKPGERVRLSVEIPRKGFLYVLDRERYADGRMGPATLIYPNFQTKRGDNSVTAGRLLEIPDRNERISSFKLVKSGPDHVGENLLILVTANPLTVDTHSRKAPIVEDAKVAMWEQKFGLQVEHLEMVGGAGKAITAAEKRSGADPNVLLTQEDPQPQSIYRVKTKPGDPIVLKLPLTIGN